MRIKISNWTLWSITFVVLQQVILTSATPIPIKNDINLHGKYEKRIIEVKKFAFSPEESEPAKREKTNEIKKRSPIFTLENGGRRYMSGLCRGSYCKRALTEIKEMVTDLKKRAPIFLIGENFKNYMSGASCDIAGCRQVKRSLDDNIQIKKRSPIFSSFEDPTRPSYDSTKIEHIRRTLDDMADGLTILVLRSWWPWKNSFSRFMPGSHITKRDEIDDLVDGLTVNLVKRGGPWWVPQKWMFGHRKREDLSNFLQEGLMDAQSRSFENENSIILTQRWNTETNSDNDEAMKQKRESNSHDASQPLKLLRRDSIIDDQTLVEIKKRSPVWAKNSPSYFGPHRRGEMEADEDELEMAKRSAKGAITIPKRYQVSEHDLSEPIKRELIENHNNKRSPIFNPKGNGYTKTQERKPTKREEDLE